MSKPWTLFAKSWKYWKNTPLGLNPVVTALMRRYTGEDNWLSSVLSSDTMDEIGSSLTGTTGKYESILSNLNNALNRLLTGDSLDNLIKWLTHSGQTDESKETMAQQLANQQILNAEEYDRKIDFYERYESPEAMVRQYKQAGLNPMMLAGSGAGQSATGGVGSAGSADAVGSGGGNLLSAISAIAGLSLQQKQVQIQEQDANTRLYDAETRRMQSQDYMRYLRSMTTKIDTENEQLVEIFPYKKELVYQQTQHFQALVDSEYVRQRLMESGISVNEAQEALMLRQEAILAAQEKYSDRYFKAVAQLTELQAKLASVQEQYERRTLENRIESAENQMYDLLFEAALKAEAFKNYTPQQVREWIKTGAQVVGAVAGAAVGAGTLAGASQARGMYQASQFQRTMSPGAAYMENGMLYPNMWTPRY